MGLFKKTFLIFLIAIFFNACGGFKRSDVKDNPINDADKRQKNIEEGRGITIGKAFNRNTGSFNFATSNEMWRASLEILDFFPLATVDYSGGVIITDWYSDDLNSDETIKIIVNFLSNEIRADAVDVTIFEKICVIEKCDTKKVQSKLEKEIKLAILKKATLMEKEGFQRYYEKRGKNKGKILDMKGRK